MDILHRRRLLLLRRALLHRLIVISTIITMIEMTVPPSFMDGTFSSISSILVDTILICLLVFVISLIDWSIDSVLWKLIVLVQWMFCRFIWIWKSGIQFGFGFSMNVMIKLFKHRRRFLIFFQFELHFKNLAQCRIVSHIVPSVSNNFISQ